MVKPAAPTKQKSLADDDLLKLEKMELSDDEDDFQYTNVDVMDDDDDDDEADFQTVLRNLNKEKDVPAIEKAPSPVFKGQCASSTIPPRTINTQVRPSVVDDFIRNFLIKISMPRTLDVFNTEWYELMAKGKLKEEDIGVVPDIYLRNQSLDDQVMIFTRSRLRPLTTDACTGKGIAKTARRNEKDYRKGKGYVGDVDTVRILGSSCLTGTWDKFRHQRDVHKMHHQRVVQEKNSLMDKIKKLRKNIAAYEPLLSELRTKYEVAMKEKMLMRLERDRFMAKTEALV
ncbi:hypothetical protein DYB32_002862 [Aphanomyces invadans]|uniref:Uncharacterized protein n=1 Tax=Aphanomyces invadans TaxID=157072 RepID=A0A418B231_9STRA|nr:hypothetical protein DYB32_002862 [Aphanomyces invadans]